MALETVLVSVVDDQIVPQPVDGVVVRVFDQTGTTFITEATTGTPLAGQVQFTLDGSGPTPTTYQLRFFISGGSIKSPQYVDVYSPPALAPGTGTNNFKITASMRTLPTATNPRLCRASGYVYRPDGQARPGIDIHFVPCFNPLVVDGYGVLGERVAVRSDEDGYVSVDLFRTGIYLVTIESQENVPRPIYVPDRSSIGIFNLLFPIARSITYTPAGPWVVPLGGSLVLSASVVATDYRTLEGVACEDISYTTDDANVAGVVVTPTSVTIYGYAAGSTTLRAARKDSSIVYIPDPGIDNAAVGITVI